MPVIADFGNTTRQRGPARVRPETLLFAGGFVLAFLFWSTMTFRLWSWAMGVGGSGASGLLETAGRLLAAGVVTFYSGRSIGFFGLSFAAHRRNLRTPQEARKSWPYVSILVPCFNESQTIVPAMESLLELDYPNFEIVVVNDGSTDDTFEKVRCYQGQFGGVSVRVFDKPNGGKWSALNHALQRAAGELLLCVDADSRLSQDALRYLVARMDAPGVEVVAGQVRVRNRSKLLTQLQALEYQLGNGAVRMGQGLCGTVLVVPGPIGLFRRSAMEEVMIRYGGPDSEDRLPSSIGPYDGDTFAEDFDLSMAILSFGGRAVYEPRAISYTKAPDRMFTLINQRYRWLRGSIQVLRKFYARSRNGTQSPSPAMLSWIAATYLPDLLAAPLLAVLGLLLSCLAVASSQALWPILGLAVGMLLAQCCVAGFFLSIHQDTAKLLRVLPVYSAYNGLLLSSVWLISVVDEFRGSAMRW